MTSLINKWIHPRVRSPGFILRALVASTVAMVIGLLVVTRYQLGISEEPLQSLRSSVFVIDRVQHTFKPGDYVVFRIDKKLANWPKGTQFVKRVVGTAGDNVVVDETATSINGEKVIGPLDLLSLLAQDASEFERDEVVPRGELFVVGENPSSYDSRYWGTVRADQIVGTGYPLW